MSREMKPPSHTGNKGGIRSWTWVPDSGFLPFKPVRRQKPASLLKVAGSTHSQRAGPSWYRENKMASPRELLEGGRKGVRK